MDAGGTDAALSDGSTATLLTNGKVLVVGGDEGTDPCYTPELYTPWTNTWAFGPVESQRRCSMPTALSRSDAQWTGARSWRDRQPGSGVHAFVRVSALHRELVRTDPALPDRAPRASDDVACLRQGAAGGRRVSAVRGRQPRGSGLYDPFTSSWAQTGSMTYFRESDALVSISGIIRALILGTGLLDVFDNSTINPSQRRGPPSTPRAGHGPLRPTCTYPAALASPPRCCLMGVC